METDYFNLRIKTLVTDAGLESFFPPHHIAAQCQAARQTFEQERLAGCDVTLSLERAENVLMETLQVPLALSSALKGLLERDFPEHPELLFPPHFSELLRRTAPCLTHDNRRQDATATGIVVEYIESVLPA